MEQTQRDGKEVEVMYKYSLNSSTKFDCPECGARNRYVRYIDNITREYLPIEFGKCDRIETCEYWHKPEQNNFIDSDGTEHSEKNLRDSYELRYAEYLKGYHVNILGEKNTFLRGLADRFGREKATKAHEEYKLGTWFDGAIIFPYIFEDCLHSGQIMFYDSDLHRLKDEKYHTTWLHQYRYTDKNKIEHTFENDYKTNCEYCDLEDLRPVLSLFGWDLIKANPDKKICLVEAPKTAVILSILLPEFVWVACTSLTGIQEYKFIYNHDRQWVLFPDLCKDGQKNIDIWEKSMKKIQYIYNTDYKIMNYYPPLMSPEDKDLCNLMGFDIADFALMESENKMNKNWLYENTTYIDYIRYKVINSIQSD